MANKVKKNLFSVWATSVTAMVLVAAIVYVLSSIFSCDPAAGLIPLSRTVVGNGFTEEDFSEESFIEEEVTFEILKQQEAQREPAEQWKTVRMRVTAYCACSRCCGKYSDGRTANNHRIRRGDTFVAADKRYRFGTEMIIPGYDGSKVVKVIDRGRAIKGNRLDVFYNSHRRAKKWGVQYLDVKVRRP